MEEKLKRFLNQLLYFLTEGKGEVHLVKEESNLKVLFQVPQAAPLIGHRGENIYYLRHLVWLFLKCQADFSGKLYLDVNNYLQEKGDKLKEWAEQEIEKVIMSGRPVSFYNLSPYERRLIHIVCAADGRVGSHSADTPRGRVLTITPHKNEDK